jgi:hypothetical protein
MGRIPVHEKKILKVFSMKDGTMLMVVENGLIWFEILPMMK